MDPVTFLTSSIVLIKKKNNSYSTARQVVFFTYTLLWQFVQFVQLFEQLHYRKRKATNMKNYHFRSNSGEFP